MLYSSPSGEAKDFVSLSLFFLLFISISQQNFIKLQTPSTLPFLLSFQFQLLLPFLLPSIYNFNSRKPSLPSYPSIPLDCVRALINSQLLLKQKCCSFAVYTCQIISLPTRSRHSRQVTPQIEHKEEGEASKKIGEDKAWKG